MKNSLLNLITGCEDNEEVINQPEPKDEDDLELRLHEQDMDTAAQHANAVAEMVDELSDKVDGMECMLGEGEFSGDLFQALYQRAGEITTALELQTPDVLGAEAFQSPSNMMMYGYAGLEGFVSAVSDGLKKLFDTIIGIFTKIKDFIAGIFTSGEHKSKAVTQAVTEIKKENFKGNLKLSGAQLKGVFDFKEGHLKAAGYSNNLWKAYAELRDLLSEAVKVIGNQAKISTVTDKVSPLFQAFAAAKQQGKKISDNNGVETYRTKMGGQEIDWTFFDDGSEIKNEEDLANRVQKFAVKLRNVPESGDYEVDCNSALTAIEDVNKFCKDNLADLNKQSVDALNIAKNLQSRVKDSGRGVLLSTKIMIAAANVFSKLTGEMAKDLARRLSAAESLAAVISSQVKKGE